MTQTDEEIEARIEELEALIDDAKFGSEEWATLSAEQATLFDEQTFRHRADPDYIDHSLGKIPDNFID